MSFIQKIWNSIRNPVRCMGRDLEGNMYYESKSAIDSTRTKRTVRYYDPENMWRYTGGGKRLPVQWSSWLTHTRQHPPTLDELEADVTRQRRVLENVKMIEAKDREEAENMRRIRQQNAHLAIEEAVAGRSSTGKVTGDGPALDRSTDLESQPHEAEPLEIRPPKYLTPAFPRNRNSLTPFSIPPLESSAEEPKRKQIGSEIDGSDSSETQTKDPFPWKTSGMATESWTPKLRKRDE